MSPREPDLTERQLEEVAALIDGKLSGDERARVIELLARSPGAFEVFAESVRYSLETAEVDAQSDVIPIHGPAPVGPSPAPGPIRWQRVVGIAAAAVIAVGVGYVATVVRSAPGLPVRPSSLVAELTAQGDLAAQLTAGWDQTGWSVTRGAATRLSGEALAFRVGARSVDLAVALRAGRPAEANRFVAELVDLLSGIPVSQPASAAFQSIATRLDAGTPAVEVLATVDDADQLLDGLRQAGYVTLGEWCEAARLAARGGLAAFFGSSETHQFLGTVGTLEVTPRLEELITQLSRSIEAGVDQTDLPELQRQLGVIFEVAGR